MPFYLYITYTDEMLIEYRRITVFEWRTPCTRLGRIIYDDQSGNMYVIFT
jgi:hypothetical protein